MSWRIPVNGGRCTALAMTLLLLVTGNAYGVIDGISGTTFNLTVKGGSLIAGDGLSVHIWSYTDDGGGGAAQYPGPTLIVNQGDTITINLKNALGATTWLQAPPNASIVFPGQEGVVASGGVPGLLTREAPPDGTTVVTYTFTASQPGTYHYHSGTRPDLQVEMGLVGAIIVRPAGFNPASPTAYGHASSAYDHEYLFLFTEMDYVIHFLVEFDLMSLVDTSDFYPVYWFINGRNLPDTLMPAGTPWLPSQPYNCLPRMHPGEKLLKRIIGAGRDLHPHHPHGNSVTVIAKDGRLLESAPGAGADLAPVLFTITPSAGQTIDAIFEWTGKGLGWDMYGHDPADDVDCSGDPTVCDALGLVCGPNGVCIEPDEDPDDHGKPFPVALPGQLEVTFGGAYSGSPYLGAMGDIPPGQGGLNFNAGYFYPWHSHHEKEVCNFDIFPGGMFTFLIIEPHGVPIP